MILDKTLLKKAVNRINKLQNETIKKADKVIGSKKFVDEQMKLFKEAEEHRKKLKAVVNKQDEISKKFVG